MHVLVLMLAPVRHLFMNATCPSSIDPIAFVESIRHLFSYSRWPCLSKFLAKSFFTYLVWPKRSDWRAGCCFGPFKSCVNESGGFYAYNT